MPNIDIVDQVVELRAKIDQQEQELESRNTLLLKARNAIENLQVYLAYFILI